MRSAKKHLSLFLVLALALFLRVYRLGELMSFGGDVARDYEVAREITLLGKIPLVGCPSSVPWLHQGAFFIYLLGLPLALGNYHPLAGGYFVALLGAGNVCLVYCLGKKLFSPQAGFWAALIYAATPLAVTFERLPYHLSLVSLFTVLFFLSLAVAYERINRLFWVSFLMGLLFQLELSNLVLLPCWLILIFLKRKQISLKALIISILAFLLPWTPKIIYDLSSGFTQTLGFAAWIFHKVVPLKLIDQGQPPVMSIAEKLPIIFTYLSRIIFWPSIAVSAIIFLVLTVFLLKKIVGGRKENIGYLLLGQWAFFPLLGFLIGIPSESYLPVLFAFPALAAGAFLGQLPRRWRWLFKTLAVLVIVINLDTLIVNDYFLITDRNQKINSYNWGASIDLDWQVAKLIVGKAGGQPYRLVLLGRLSHFPSTAQTYQYLTWYLGNRPQSQAKNLFFLYDREREDPKGIEWVEEFTQLKVAKRIND